MLMEFVTYMTHVLIPFVVDWTLIVMGFVTLMKQKAVQTPLHVITTPLLLNQIALASYLIFVEFVEDPVILVLTAQEFLTVTL
tara:strand:+ start:117 stop:365 length:249 start_codon:yes stop_codon:yes gene_type:complete